MQQRVDNLEVAEPALQRLAWGVHNAAGFVFMLAWTAGLISLALLMLLFTRRRDWALRMAARCWAPALLAGTAARLEVEGAERIDYARIVDRETLEPLEGNDRPAVAIIAVHVGTTRLIDNLLLEPARA